MIKKIKFLTREGMLRVKYKIMKDCIFCKMTKGEMKADKLFETEKVFAIADINPVSETHILVIPKKHIDSVLTITKDDSSDIVDMYSVAKELVKKSNLEAFRLSFNGGKFQHVSHLHMHLIAGNKVDWSKL